MTTWYYREIFIDYLQVLECIKLCVNWHLQFILRTYICSLTILWLNTARFSWFGVFSLVLSLTIQLHHQHFLKFFLWFLLGSLSYLSLALSYFHASKTLLVPFSCHLHLWEGLVFLGVLEDSKAFTMLFNPISLSFNFSLIQMYIRR